MTGNRTVLDIGAVCFGLVVGYITYRTLVRAHSGGVSDLAAVVAAIGGGTVTIFNPTTDTFGWYSIGLAIGLGLYGGLYWFVNGRKRFGEVMGDEKLRPPR